MDTQKRRGTVRRGVLLGLVLSVAFTLAAGGARRYRQTAADVCADTLRLHILANSDTVADQCAKLRVRDALLTELAPLLHGAADRRQAETRVLAALPRLRRVAAAASGQSAAVRLEQAAFSGKDYGGFALPGGRYAALRVELGAAAGHNWFCVLYPALCVPGTVAEYPDEAENDLVFGRYRVRFAVWEWLRGVLPSREG